MRARTYWPILRDYALMTVGAVLVAAAVNLVLAPNNVVTGGITGAAIMLRDAIGTPIGAVTLLANIPLFVLGWRRLGGLVFGARTIYATVVMAVAIDALAPLMRPVTADPLLYTLYGGLLDGIGVGLVFRAQGTTGGIDILARLLELRYGFRPGRSMLAMNLAVFAAAFLLFGPEKVLYAILAAFVGSVALDYTLSAGSGAQQALIITSRPDDIRRALLNDLGRGVTILEGRGGYTGEARAVLLCVVARSEVSLLQALISRHDPHAFVIIGEAREVLGEGFRPFATSRRSEAADDP